jgi:hypothetical protein
MASFVSRPICSFLSCHDTNKLCSWIVGPNWPSGGEIDIIEGVNLNSLDQITLHTSTGCSPGIGSAGESGNRIGETDCGAGGGFNGCGVQSQAGTSYGTPFNANGGGVYATLWTSSAIQVWYWPASQVPGDIRNSAPNPSGWGQPIANFVGCNFDGHFYNMNVVSIWQQLRSEIYGPY